MTATQRFRESITQEVLNTHAHLYPPRGRIRVPPPQHHPCYQLNPIEILLLVLLFILPRSNNMCDANAGNGDNGSYDSDFGDNSHHCYNWYWYFCCCCCCCCYYYYYYYYSTPPAAAAAHAHAAAAAAAPVQLPVILLLLSLLLVSAPAFALASAPAATSAAAVAPAPASAARAAPHAAATFTNILTPTHFRIEFEV